MQYVAVHGVQGSPKTRLPKFVRRAGERKVILNLRTADLYARKELKINQPFVNESIIGTLFRRQIVGETKIGDFPAIVPEITGSAYITGINQFLVSQDDPLKDGFLVVSR